METTTDLLSPRKVAQGVEHQPEDALDLMLTGRIRTVSDNGVPMVPASAIDEYRRSHAP